MVAGDGAEGAVVGDRLLEPGRQCEYRYVTGLPRLLLKGSHLSGLRNAPAIGTSMSFVMRTNTVGEVNTILKQR